MIVSTPAAVDHLNGRIADAARRRPIGPKTLLRLAKAELVPVFEWTDNGPLFSTVQLDAWEATYTGERAA